MATIIDSIASLTKAVIFFAAKSELGVDAHHMQYLEQGVLPGGIQQESAREGVGTGRISRRSHEKGSV